MEVDVDEALGIAIRLARQGYGGGDPRVILKMPSSMVMTAAHYENFIVDYESTYVELNRED